MNTNSNPATNTLRSLALVANSDRDDISGGERSSMLNKSGFDVVALRKQVTESIRQARGRAELAVARGRRLTMGQKVQDLIKQLPKLPDPRAAVRRLLESSVTGRPQAAVMFSKLEATKDSDLESLLEDLALLDLIDEDTNTDR